MQVKVLQNAPREHSAILSTFIRLPFVFKTSVLSIFEWPLNTIMSVTYIDRLEKFHAALSDMAENPRVVCCCQVVPVLLR